MKHVKYMKIRGISEAWNNCKRLEFSLSIVIYYQIVNSTPCERFDWKFVLSPNG